ncbi:hypothetical protein GCM10028808_57430 [Spirosoma migulaei]
MSNRYRNPFKVRASEKLETDSNFLRMYSPYILDALIDKNKEDKLWNNVLFLRSSPGAGKTSILKVFEPNCLLTLTHNKSAQHYKDTLNYLKTLQIIDDEGINVLGVYLSCARNYEVLEDLSISDGQKKRLFFALINARLILFTLKNLLTLFNDSNLSDITLNASKIEYSYLDITFPCNGVDLFNWASGIEKNIFKAIDSFLPITEDKIQGHDELFAFDLMQEKNIILANKTLPKKILFMFDDTHKLSKVQREHLIKYLTVIRKQYNIWLAERLEALDENDNFGSFKNRDYDEINLEKIWQDSSKFKTIVANIAEKRAALSSEGLTSLQSYLEDNINESNFDAKLINAHEVSIKRIIGLTSFTHKFDKWVQYIYNQPDLTHLQKAILARQAEIIINRTVGKSQLSLDFPLEVKELTEKLGGEILATSVYFTSIEHKIPYYFGFDTLVKLASYNIEQFLSFAADLFELMLSRQIADKQINLTATDQERLLKKIADNKWNELNRLIPYSSEVLRFLQNFCSFSQKETNKPSAPYAPGVNGFAIKESSDNKLLYNGPWTTDEAFKPLRNVLTTCLAYNLLETRITKQGKQNQQWTVYYLNRWICLRYNLPLSYGGWRARTPQELLKWTK